MASTLRGQNIQWILCMYVLFVFFFKSIYRLIQSFSAPDWTLHELIWWLFGFYVLYIFLCLLAAALWAGSSCCSSARRPAAFDIKHYMFYVSGLVGGVGHWPTPESRSRRRCVITQCALENLAHLLCRIRGVSTVAYISRTVTFTCRYESRRNTRKSPRPRKTTRGPFKLTLPRCRARRERERERGLW